MLKLLYKYLIYLFIIIVKCLEFLKEFSRLFYYFKNKILNISISKKEIGNINSNLIQQFNVNLSLHLFWLLQSKGLTFSHPGMALMVAIKIAEVRGITVDKVLQQVRLNTKAMYGI